jgi:Ca-activated chloride channel family protein
MAVVLRVRGTWRIQRVLRAGAGSLCVFMMACWAVAPVLPIGMAGGFPAVGQDEPIKLKATLVQVPVVASDAGGRYVIDLKKGDFKLLEDGVVQQIEFFAAVDQPFTVALLLDSSGSTMDQLNQIKAAAMAFLDNLRPQDRVLIMSFDDSVHVQCDFTSDRGVLRRAVESIQPGEYTQVYEAIYTAVWERLKKITGRRAVIVFTDGIDTASSEIDDDDTLNAVAETEGVLVYPIRYSTREDVERRLRKRKDYQGETGEERIRALDRTYRAADEYLGELADLSGGIVERADTLKDLNGAFARIAAELRQQYLLGYYPTNTKENDSERKISVQVARQGVKVRSRPGYRVSQ